jgi:hypothetical protein
LGINTTIPTIIMGFSFFLLVLRDSVGMDCPCLLFYSSTVTLLLVIIIRVFVTGGLCLTVVLTNKIELIMIYKDIVPAKLPTLLHLEWW